MMFNEPELGRSTEMMCITLRTSRPRAATDVHTKIGHLPVRKARLSKSVDDHQYHRGITDIASSRSCCVR